MTTDNTMTRCLKRGENKMTDKPKNDGGPAFPTMPSYHPDNTIQYHGNDGMTMRDWFAGMALQGLLSSRDHNTKNMVSNHPSGISETAYTYADAMLKEREKSRNTSDNY